MTAFNKEGIESICNQINDVIDFAWLKHLIHPVDIKFNATCPYRYDDKEKAIYAECTIKNDYYSYIAKSRYQNIYKVGHTKNLTQRAVDLKRNKPYSELELDIIAFCEKDYEFELLAVANSKNRILPAPLNKMKELMFISDSDAERIIDLCGFTRVQNGKLPKHLKRIQRVYFHPTTGECIKIENSYSFEY